MPTCAGTVCPFAVVAVELVAVVPVVAFIFSTQSSIEVIEQPTFYTRTALAHAALTPGPDSWGRTFRFDISCALIFTASAAEELISGLAFKHTHLSSFAHSV